jgi:periplasmic copper chaperone A
MMMIRFFYRALIALFLAYPLNAMAHDFKIGALKIDHPWSRATPKGAKVAGGFMSITNTGTIPDRLIGGSAEFSALFEVHEMRMEGGVMKMRALEKGLEIKPGETVKLQPGGYHVMFMDLKGELNEGSTVKGTLIFEKAGKIEVEYKIEPRGSTGGHQH